MKGLPYGQFLRICSKDSDFERHSATQAAQLIEQGYPETLLVEAMLKAKTQSREKLLSRKPEEVMTTEKVNFLTTTYNRDYPDLRTQVESTWELL